MSNKKLDEAGKRAARKMKRLLQHKTLELLMYDMVSLQGMEETKKILKFWLARLDEY